MKLYIFGSVASGKTTLAKKLSEQMGIPYYEGDSIAWGFPEEERFKRTPEQQKERIAAIDAAGDWIVEGGWRVAQSDLWELADRIIFLDTPLLLRKKRIWSRFLRQRCGKEDCGYKPTISMLRMMMRWTETFENERAEHEARLLSHADKLIWLASDDLADAPPDWLDLTVQEPCTESDKQA